MTLVLLFAIVLAAVPIHAAAAPSRTPGKAPNPGVKAAVPPELDVHSAGKSDPARPASLGAATADSVRKSIEKDRADTEEWLQVQAHLLPRDHRAARLRQPPEPHGRARGRQRRPGR